MTVTKDFDERDTEEIQMTTLSRKQINFEIKI